MLLISTVTTISAVTSTTTATSSATSAAGASLTYQLGLVAVISLIILLVVNELAGAYSVELEAGGMAGLWPSRLEQVLNLGILPLLYVFGVIVVVKVVQILGL